MLGVFSVANHIAGTSPSSDGFTLLKEEWSGNQVFHVNLTVTLFRSTPGVGRATLPVDEGSILVGNIDLIGESFTTRRLPGDNCCAFRS